MKYSKKFYNDVYLKKISKLSEEYKLDKAIYEFQKYLQNYPQDVEGYIFYANVLIKANRLEEAELALYNAENAMTYRTPEVLKMDYILIKIKLLCHQKKYEDCYRYLINNETALSNSYGIDELIFFLRKKLGLLNEKDLEHRSYVKNLIDSYNEQAVLLNIKKKRYGSNNRVFTNGFDQIETYYKLRKMLPLEQKVIKGFFKEAYLLKYEGNGYVNNNLVDYIEVITLQDSNDIITMYPYENKERRLYTDLTPDIEDCSKLKRSRVSQIDKFNQRYGKK